MNYGLIASYFLSFIAACAWIPYILEKAKRLKLRGKILQHRKLKIYNSGRDNFVPYIDKNNYTILLFRYKLIVENHDFLVDRIETYVKFEGIDKKKKFLEFYSSKVYYENNSFGHQLSIDFQDRVIGHGVLIADKAYELFSTVFINEKIDNNIDYVVINLRDFKGKVIKTKIMNTNENKFIEIEDTFWADKSLV